MRQATERLAAVDEANLVLDHAGQVNVFLVAGLLVHGGLISPDGTPDVATLRSALAERVTELPPLRKIPVATGRRHRWDEMSPDLEHHIRLVESVDGLAGLERLCTELMSAPLRLDRPLWEILVVPGASPGQIGVVLRIHHAVADGMAAVAIARQLFDSSEPGLASAWAPAVSQSRPGTEQRPRRDVRSVLRRLGYALRRIRMTLTGREVGSTVLLGEISQRRGVAFVDVDLAALEARVHPFGATVNDALLASVASGYRAALPAAGEQIPARLPVSVPVALQRSGTSGNQVGVMLVRLPLDVPAPDERLRLIAEQTRAEKVQAREQGTLEFMRGPVGARIMDRIAQRQHVVGGFVTNVPGPAGTLRIAGVPLVAIWPVAVLAANVRLGVAAVSYAGRLSCSVHFDAANVPGAAFVRAMSEELTRLSAAPESPGQGVGTDAPYS
jgi:diacylglycerol O-acyltransferase